MARDGQIIQQQQQPGQKKKKPSTRPPSESSSATTSSVAEILFSVMEVAREAVYIFNGTSAIVSPSQHLSSNNVASLSNHQHNAAATSSHFVDTLYLF